MRLTQMLISTLALGQELFYAIKTYQIPTASRCFLLNYSTYPINIDLMLPQSVKHISCDNAHDIRGAPGMRLDISEQKIWMRLGASNEIQVEK